MKIVIKLWAILIFSLAVLAFACASNEQPKIVDGSNQSLAPNADNRIYKSTGVIKKIDVTGGKLTIDHEDIPGYMAAMEMTAAAADESLLNDVRVGDKIEFEIERAGAQILITKINKIGEAALLDGGEIYQANCARCHGESGAGAEKGIPLIKGHALHHSEQEYLEQVANGEGKKMPAFKNKLSAEQIAAVVKFVREDLQKEARQNEKTGAIQHAHH